MTVCFPNNTYKNQSTLASLQEIYTNNHNSINEFIALIDNSGLLKTNVFKILGSDSNYDFGKLFRVLAKSNNDNLYNFGLDGHWNKPRSAFTYQLIITKMLDTSLKIDHNKVHVNKDLESDFIRSRNLSPNYFSEVVIPVFHLPNFYVVNNNPASIAKNNKLNQNEEYRLLNNLTINDFYKLDQTIGKPDQELFNCVQQLIQEKKINPSYKLLFNTSVEEFNAKIIESNISFGNREGIPGLSNEDVNHMRNLMFASLKHLQTLSDVVMAFYRITTKGLTLFKNEDNFANYEQHTVQRNNYYNLFSDCTGVNFLDQTYYTKSVSQLNFEGFKFKPSFDENNHLLFTTTSQEHYYDAKHCHLLDQKINNLPVLSFLPKEFLAQLTISTIDKQINFQKHMPTYISYSKIEQKEDSLSVAPLGDFSFVGDDFEIYIPGKVENQFSVQTYGSGLSVNSNELKTAFSRKVYQNVETVNLKTLFESNLRLTNNKITALVLNNFCSGGSDGFNFEIKLVTKNQLLTSNNMFVPFAFRTTILNNVTFEEEVVYYVNLVCFQSFNNFRKFTKSQKFIQYLDNLIITDSILNPETYAQILSQRYGSVVRYYISQKEIFNKIGSSVIDRLSQRTNDSNLKLIDSQRLSILNGKLNIDEKLSQEIARLSLSNEKIKEKLDEETNKLTELTTSESRLSREITVNQELINQYQQKIKEIQELTRELPEKIKTQSIKLDKQRELFNSFTSQFNQIKDKYQKEEQEAIRLKNFTADPFFSNLNSRGIFITRISLSDSRNIHELTNLTLNSITNDQYSKMTIVEVDFIVAKPIEIKVDGDANNIVYGGPYKVSVSNDSLKIAPLNPSTIIATLGNGSYCVHPHSSSFTLNKSTTSNEFYSYKRCCLGESSSYIYNAFKCKSTEALKMILVNTFIWLSSANSSDAWGRNYKYYPKKGDQNLINLDQICINLDNLVAISETPEESIEVSEETIQLALQEENDYQWHNEDHNHEWDADGMCIDCDAECEHECHYADGHCMECGVYHEWGDRNIEDNEENNEEEQTQTTNATYVPYVQLTNNNQG